MNTFSWHKGIFKYTCCRDSVGQRSIIDFCFVSADLFFSVVDVRIKRAAKLSSDHHLIICIPRSLNYSRTRKQFRARRAYRIKWKLLAEEKLRRAFANKVTSRFRVLPDFSEDVETEWD